MYRTLFGIAAAIALALVAVGFTFSTVAEERADLVFLNGTEPETLDPQKMTGQPEGRIADALLEGLTYYDARTFKPTPGSATSWDMTPDGLRWTFHLRPEARWSNGEPLTAHDFVYAWVRLQDPELASEYAYLMHVVRHAEVYNTHPKQIKALRGDPKADAGSAERAGILAGLDRLLGEHPGGLPAATWRKWALEVDLAGAVTRVPDPVLFDALGRREGALTPDEGREIRRRLVLETERRERALEEARAHFGKDQGVFAADDRTLVVELKAFTPYFLELTAFYPNHPVHRPTVERWRESWFLPGRFVGNGPFVLEVWDINRKIRLRRSPTYWGRDAVRSEVVDAIPLDNQSTALNLYLTGEIDCAPTGYPLDLIDKVRVRKDFQSNAGNGVYYYRFNCTQKPFDDPRVREAFCLAFDRKVVVEEIARAGQMPATTCVPPGTPGYESPENEIRFDPERARRLLAEAGYPGGAGFPKTAILYNTHEGHKKIAENVAYQWKDVLGVDVNAYNQEWQSYQETTRKLEYQIARAAWIADYRDPNTFLDMWITNGGNNQTGWGDPTYDRLIALASDVLGFADRPAADREAILARLRDRPRAEAHLTEVLAAKDPAERLRAAAALRFDLFREAEAILFREQFPICPVYFYVYTALVNPRVEGYYSRVQDETGEWVDNLKDIHPFRDLYLRPEDGEQP